MTVLLPPTIPAWFTSRTTTRLLTAAWAGLLLARGLLLGHGALADYDERRYFQSLTAVRALAHGHWREAAYALSMTAARPADALLRCVPAAGQLALQKLGFDLFDYPSLLLPTGLNWLATGLAGWLFYHISCRLLADVAAPRQWALVAAVLYAALANTSLYVRHVLPYDWALLLLLLLLAWVLRWPARASVGRWLGLGLGAGLLWLLYPGYYAGPPLLLAALLDWRQPLRWVWQHAGQLVALGLGFGGPLLAAEALSRFGGATPFWAVSRDLSLHILQGDPAEGYTFPIKYLWRVEGAVSMLLLAGAALALAQVAQHLGREGVPALVPHTPRQRVLAGALLLFLAHATAAAVGHRIVWYGRLLHLYLPWLVLAAVAALAQVRRDWAAGAGLAAGAVALVSYSLFWVDYQRILYPPDVIAAQHLNCLSGSKVRYTEDVRVSLDMRFLTQGPSAPRCRFWKPPQTDSISLLVNFAVLYPLTPATRTTAALPPPGTARLLVDGPHYLSFPAYEFEGLSPAERTEADLRQFRLRVFLMTSDE